MGEPTWIILPMHKLMHAKINKWYSIPREGGELRERRELLLGRASKNIEQRNCRAVCWSVLWIV